MLRRISNLIPLFMETDNSKNNKLMLVLFKDKVYVLCLDIFLFPLTVLYHVRRTTKHLTK